MERKNNVISNKLEIFKPNRNTKEKNGVINFFFLLKRENERENEKKNM